MIMVMSITEASAAQQILDLATDRLARCRATGMSDDDEVMVNDVPVRLGVLIAAGRVLADKSYAALHAGVDGQRWTRRIDERLGVE